MLKKNAPQVTSKRAHTSLALSKHIYSCLENAPVVLIVFFLFGRCPTTPNNAEVGPVAEMPEKGISNSKYHSTHLSGQQP